MKTENWIRGTGFIQVYNGIRIVTHFDLCRYYRWHIEMAHYQTFSPLLPTHGAHITIVNPKIHKVTDYRPVNHFHNQEVEFFYKPEEMYISAVNFWMPAYSSLEGEIKYRLNIKDGPNYWGLHLTVANKKYQKFNE